MKLSDTKSKQWIRILVATFLGLLLIYPAVAQVPQLINYQGRVVVGATNFNGSGQFEFALVNTNGSTTYWSNDGTSTAGSQPTSPITLTVANGLYSVVLGDTAVTNMTAVPPSVFNNSDVRLRVWFNDGTHGFQLLTPDQRIAAVGYAMVANTAENVAPGAVNSAAIAPGAVGSSQLASSINLSGTVSAGSFTGSGSGLTSVNAVTLGGLNSSSFAPSSGSASYIQNSTSQELGSFNLSGTGALGGSMTAASFSGSGSGLTNLSAANVSGTLSNATLPSPYTAALTFSNTVSFSNAQGTFTLLNSSSAPAAASSSNAGQLYFDSTKNALTYSDGTVWNTVPGQQLNYVQGYDNEFQYSFTNSTPVAATGRTLNFTKLHANTRLRITYSDNVGILSAGGGTPMASWEVVLDGSSIGPLKTTVYLVPNTNGILIPCHLEGYVPGISAGAHQIVVDVYPVNLSGGTTLQTMTGFKSSYLLQVEEIP